MPSRLTHACRCAEAGKDDGQLYAYEIGELRLPGTLVVLSGCETGAGRLLGGEGVLSLSRAFLRAGASGTVATLWPVGPGTAELMTTFYQGLSHDASVPVALRDAKLALRRGSRANPLYWAGFTLVTQAALSPAGEIEPHGNQSRAPSYCSAPPAR